MQGDHSDARMGSGKTPNVWEENGKAKRKEFTLKIKCFLCDNPHWSRDCPKRKALCAIIKKKEHENEAHMGLMKLLGALQVNLKPSTPKTSILSGVQVMKAKGK